MPTYEYTCKACQHYLETSQSIHDAPLVDCPNCHEATLERLISMTRFHLKGKGWYRDEINTPVPSSSSSSESTTAS
jgi:putative FmdB family regulatory protein